MSLKFQLDRFTLTLVRVCGKGHSKTDRQTDRQTDTYIHTDRLSGTTFLDVLKVVHLKSGFISNSIFLHDDNTSIEMEVTMGWTEMLFLCFMVGLRVIPGEPRWLIVQ